MILRLYCWTVFNIEQAFPSCVIVIHNYPDAESHKFQDDADKSYDEVGDIPVAGPERPEMLGQLQYDLKHKYHQHCATHNSLISRIGRRAVGGHSQHGSALTRIR